MADSDVMSFWDHLDQLRGSLLRMAVAVAVAAVVAFAFKELLFAVILAPAHHDFVSYRLMGAQVADLHLVNTQLTEQFMVHVRVAAYVGLLVASPIVLFELFRFVSPALYKAERRYAVKAIVAAYAMFMVGTLVDYFVVFPITLQFLATYQVSGDVANLLTIDSYVDTLTMMSLLLALMFELPIVAAVLAKMHLITASLMARWRRHAVVTILIVAAIITPTADVFTLLVVAMPIYLLYEMSIVVVRKINA